MPKDPTGSANTTPALAAAAGRAAEAHALQTAGMDDLRHVLQEANEYDLRLHRQTLNTITAIRKDLERVKRSLRALGTVRS